MVTATPTNIGEVLRQILDEAMKQAAQQPEHLSDVIKQVEQDANKIVDNAERIPQQILDELQQPPFRPPDWWSLMVFLLLRIRDLLNDPRLTVGYRHPAGWSRMVTLNYSEDSANPDTTIIATVGLAITDPGATQGVWLQVIKDFQFSLGSGPLHVDMKASGRADWQYVVGAAMTKPAQQAQASIDIQWTPWSAGLHPAAGALDFQLGAIHLSVALSAAPTDPLYRVTVGLGSDSASGVTAGVDAHKFLGDALSSFINIAPVDESYSPQLVLTQGGSPQFTLGHRGIG